MMNPTFNPLNCLVKLSQTFLQSASAVVDTRKMSDWEKKKAQRRKARQSQMYPLHRTPYALHPTPHTLHLIPTPYTLHPAPDTLHYTPYMLYIPYT